MKKTVLLLTGAVNTDGVPFMKRSDTNIRLIDYRKSIHKWLKNKHLRIVFVENSNFPFSEFNIKDSELNRFEYLTYNGQINSKSRGKGFGEINSFQYAFDNSEFLKDADYIIKCNGRYYFKNINKLILKIENSDEDILGNFQRKLTFMDSRVFVFNKDFFTNYFIKYKGLIDDNKCVYFEHALAMACHELLSNGGKWGQLPIPLIIKGYSGTGDFDYDGALNRMKLWVKFYLQKKLF